MTPRKFNPKTEALAFRIWQAARARDWQVTVKELADELGENWQRIVSVLRGKGWATRLPSANSEHWRFRVFPPDVPLYDAVWHHTHARAAHETVNVIRRFAPAD